MAEGDRQPGESIVDWLIRTSGATDSGGEGEIVQTTPKDPQRAYGINGPQGYGDYWLDGPPDANGRPTLGTFIGSTQAPRQAPQSAPPTPRPGLTAIADLEKIPGYQRQGSVILVPSVTGGGYYDRYEVDPYFGDRAAFGSAFKPETASTGADTAGYSATSKLVGGVNTFYVGGNVVGKQQGDRVVPVGGWTIAPDGKFLPPGGTSTQTTAPPPAAPSTSTSTETTPPPPPLGQQGLTRGFDTAAGTSSTVTQENGESRGESGGYLYGPAALGFDNPLEKKGAYAKDDPNTEEDEELLDYATMQREAEQMGLTRSRVSSKSPGIVTFLRAKGGPIRPGHPYIVGEQGPELIVPDAPGQVIPNPATEPDPAVEASRLWSQANRQREATGYHYGLAGLNTPTRIPYAFNGGALSQQSGTASPVANPPLPPGFEYDIPNIGGQIINLRNQLLTATSGAQQRDMNEQISGLKLMLGQIYPQFAKSVLPTEPAPKQRGRGFRPQLGTGLVA